MCFLNACNNNSSNSDYCVSKACYVPSITLSERYTINSFNGDPISVNEHCNCYFTDVETEAQKL